MVNPKPSGASEAPFPSGNDDCFSMHLYIDLKLFDFLIYLTSDLFHIVCKYFKQNTGENRPVLLFINADISVC